MDEGDVPTEALAAHVLLRDHERLLGRFPPGQVLLATGQSHGLPPKSIRREQVDLGVADAGPSRR